MTEFPAGVVGGEMPVDLALAGVGGVLPGGELGIEGGEVADAAVQQWAGFADKAGVSGQVSVPRWPVFFYPVND